MRVFAIRPEPGLSASIAAGAAAGIPVTGFALSRIAACGWTLPDLDEIDALLVGSANVFRHGGEKLDALAHLPVLAVGKATAQAASEAGFVIAAIGSGGLQSLLDTLDGQYRHLLRLAGEEHVALEFPSGTDFTTRVVYKVQDTDITKDFEALLGEAGLILLHSGGAARHFANECDRLGIDRDKISLAALGPRILEAAGGGWRAARACENPEEAELLALARDMCQ